MKNSRALIFVKVLGTVCAAAIASLVPRLGAAQSPDSLPFRKGQWGAEFNAGSFAGLGIMRFLSPRVALIGDVSGTVVRSSTTQ